MQWTEKVALSSTNKLVGPEVIVNKHSDGVQQEWFLISTGGTTLYSELESHLYNLGGRSLSQSADSIHAINLLTSGLFTTNVMWIHWHVLSKM